MQGCTQTLLDMEKHLSPLGLEHQSPEYCPYALITKVRRQMMKNMHHTRLAKSLIHCKSVLHLKATFIDVKNMYLHGDSNPDLSDYG